MAKQRRSCLISSIHKLYNESRIRYVLYNNTKLLSKHKKILIGTYVSHVQGVFIHKSPAGLRQRRQRSDVLGRRPVRHHVQDQVVHLHGGRHTDHHRVGCCHQVYRLQGTDILNLSLMITIMIYFTKLRIKRMFK